MALATIPIFRRPPCFLDRFLRAMLRASCFVHPIFAPLHLLQLTSPYTANPPPPPRLLLHHAAVSISALELYALPLRSRHPCCAHSVQMRCVAVTTSSPFSCCTRSSPTPHQLKWR